MRTSRSSTPITKIDWEPIGVSQAKKEREREEKVELQVKPIFVVIEFEDFDEREAPTGLTPRVSGGLGDLIGLESSVKEGAAGLLWIDNERWAIVGFSKVFLLSPSPFLTYLNVIRFSISRR